MFCENETFLCREHWLVLEIFLFRCALGAQPFSMTALFASLRTCSEHWLVLERFLFRCALGAQPFSMTALFVSLRTGVAGCSERWLVLEVCLFHCAPIDVQFLHCFAQALQVSIDTSWRDLC